MKKDFHRISGQSNKTEGQSSLLDDSQVPAELAGISEKARACLQKLAPEALQSGIEARPVNRFERRLVESRNRKKQRLPDAERKARKRARSARKDARRYEWLRRRISGYAPNAHPTLIKDATWSLCRMINAAPGPAPICSFLRNTKNKLMAGTLRHAALGLQPDGSYRYSWQDDRARAIAALAVALWQTAKRVTTSTGKIRYVVMGVPYAAWRRLLSHPRTRELPAEQTVNMSRHRSGACLADGQVGYMRALVESGFCFAQKVKPSDARPFERAGPSGFACLRIWIISPDPERAISDPEKVRLRELRESEIAQQKAEKSLLADSAVYTTWPDPAAPLGVPGGATGPPEARPPP